jgi:aminotransferase EvaB
MTIKVWDYLREYEDERDDILAGVDKVFRSGRLVLGESVRGFEAAFAAYCGMPHGVGVDNATNGLTLALRALGIGHGDEVITVANTAVPTVSAIVSAGATPRFADVDPDTALMDPASLEAAITPRTRCLLPVHLYGQCCDMAAIGAIARRHGMTIVEDCSQSHGATQRGVKAGAFGDLSVFSFYPTKPLGGYGDGGMVLCRTEEQAAKLRRLRLRHGHPVLRRGARLQLTPGRSPRRNPAAQVAAPGRLHRTPPHSGRPLQRLARRPAPGLAGGSGG